MNDIVQPRRFWLIFGVITWTLFVTVSRAIREPNGFALSQWLIDYSFGFMKRGLVGSIASVFSNLLGIPITHEFVTFAAGIIAVLFYLALLAVFFRLLKRETLRAEVVLAILLFVTSPFIVMNAHVFGYFDALLYLLTLLTLGLIFRGKYYLAAGVQVVAVLCHESYLIIGFPAACLAIYFRCVGMDWRQKWRYFLVQCTPVVAFGIVLIVMATTDPATLHDDLTARFVGAGLRRFGELFARLQLRGFTENLRRNWMHVPTRLFNSNIWQQLGPVLCAQLFLIYYSFQIRILSLKSLVLLAIVFVPLAIHCIAFDAMRISTYTIASAFLMYWVLAETQASRAAVPAPKTFYFVAVLILVYHAVMHVTLMDRQTDRFSLPLRLALYAPMLILAIRLLITRFFPQGAIATMTSPKSFLVFALGLLFTSSLMGCSESVPAKVQDPEAALDAAQSALSNDESLSEQVIGSVLAIDTDDVDTLLRLAATSHAMGRLLYNEKQTRAAANLFLKAGEAMQKVEKSGQELSDEESENRGTIYYDQACAFSLLGEPEKALSPLRSSVELGFGDLGMFDQDSDLDAVRKLPEYPEFYKKTLNFVREQLAEEMLEFRSYPFDLNLTDLDGKPLVLSEMKGKVVVIDFWATWCRPCLMSMPHLEEIYQTEKSKGLEVIGLDYEGSRGDGDTMEKVKRILSELKISYPCAIGDKATEDQVPNKDSIPTMVFIGRTGKVRFQLSGAHSRDYLMAIIEPLLAEPVPE